MTEPGFSSIFRPASSDEPPEPLDVEDVDRIGILLTRVDQLHRRLDVLSTTLGIVLAAILICLLLLLARDIPV
jgi:hypothetical protein